MMRVFTMLLMMVVLALSSCEKNDRVDDLSVALSKTKVFVDIHKAGHKVAWMIDEETHAMIFGSIGVNLPERYEVYRYFRYFRSTGVVQFSGYNEVGEEIWFEFRD
jgi:hypothetical protein